METDANRVEQLLRIVESMTHIRHRIRLYVMPVDVASVNNFLSGYHTVCNALSVSPGFDRIYEQIVNERGWKWTSFGFEDEMKRNGHSDEEIIEELLVIELEAWQRRHEAARRNLDE